jgi:hypothetical protein
MKDRIEFEDDGRDGRSEFRARALFEIGLWAYAVISALIVARILILAFNVEGNVWVVDFIEGLTNIFAWPLQRLPGGDRQIAGELTIADVTLLAFVLLVPLFLIAVGNQQRGRQGL